MKLVTVEEMRDLEQRADAAGHSYATMMENAGRAVAEAIQERMQVRSKRVLVLVGPGNNGGDGLVAARYLSKAGAQIICYLWKPRPSDDPNLEAAREHNVHCLQGEGEANGKMLSKALQNVDLIVDALLGTGVTGLIEGSLKELLDRVRQAVHERRSPVPTGLIRLVPPRGGGKEHGLPAPYIVAVDVPSGMHCDTGEVDPATLSADLTVTFAAAKRGQFLFPGSATVGELLAADIGINPELASSIHLEVATTQAVSLLLPARPAYAHKGTFGKAMIVAGSVNYTGAPYLCAAGAARVGTGLVTLAPPQPIHAILASKLTEATYVLLPHNMGVYVPSAVRVLAPRLEGYTALLLGPGIGQEDETVAFVHELLGLTPTEQKRHIGFQPKAESGAEPAALPPLVIDADGLNAIARAQQWWKSLPANSILTPHPGEMSRLTGVEAKEINEDRIAVAQERAEEWQQVVVLKGAYTVVAAPDGRTMLMPFANPGLATAGTGDVLAGAIVGMLAQGLAPYDAAVCGAYLHGLAGEIAAGRTGAAGVLAGDLLPALPEAIQSLHDTEK
jgi:NAD(P)H-hydrate epimerase